MIFKSKQIIKGLVSGIYTRRERIISLISKDVPSCFFNISLKFHTLHSIKPIPKMRTQILLTSLFTFFLAFSSIAGDLQITSPQSNSTTHNKSIMSITWETGNSAKLVNIEYIHRSFNTNFFSIANQVPNNGQYDWDLSRIASGTISIKITDHGNPRNYSIVDGIQVQKCTVFARFSDIDQLCTDQVNVIKNESKNATSFEWQKSGKVISTKKDLELQLNSFQDFKLTLIASNDNCFDTYYVDLYAPNLGTTPGPCENPVIQEMVIVDNNEVARFSHDIPVSIETTDKILAFQLTHQQAGNLKINQWNWSKQAIPGFSKDCLDFSKEREDGIVTVNWTSPDPTGTAYTGSLYTLAIDAIGAMPFVEETEEPLTRRRRKVVKRDIVRNPTTIGKMKLSYKKLDTSNQTTPVKLKTTGMILTTDGVIILE